MSIKLYELKAGYDQLIEKVNQIAEDNNGEIPEELSNELDQVESSLEEKIVNCGCAYKNHIAEADAIDAEIKRLTIRKRIVSNTAEWIKKYMSVCMPAGFKYNSPQVSISWRNSNSVVIDNESALPEQYFKIEKNPMKTEIKKAIESGEKIDGAHIEQKSNIQIK